MTEAGSLNPASDCRAYMREYGCPPGKTPVTDASALPLNHYNP